MTATILYVPAAVVASTIAELQAGGARKSERVVFWLGRRCPSRIQVNEAFVPQQHADYDYFRIPPAAMRQLFAHLRTRESMIAAQVHSHPGEAFHSEADDRWAIVRHEGALSIVLPNFGSTAHMGNILPISATYRLDELNRWVEVPYAMLTSIVQITP